MFVQPLLNNLPTSLPDLNSLVYLLACPQVLQLMFSLSRTVTFAFVFQLFHGVDYDIVNHLNDTTGTSSCLLAVP